MKPDYIQTANGLRLDEDLQFVLGRAEEGQSGLGILLSVEAPPSFGKTSAVEDACRRRGGIMIQAHEYWATWSMLYEMAHEICGLYIERHRIAELYHRVLEDLALYQVPFLAIDEADQLDRGGRYDLLNLLRQLSDDSRVPIVFVSVGRLAARFARPNSFTAQVTSRLAARIQFRAPSLKDAKDFTRLLEKVTFDDDLIGACLNLADDSLRALFSIFGEIEKLAHSAGVERLNLAKANHLRSLAGLAPLTAKLSAAKKIVAGKPTMPVEKSRQGAVA